MSMVLSSIVLAVFSVINCWRWFNPSYMRSFPVYALVNVAVNMVTVFDPPTREVTQNSFTLFETVYFGYFLFRATTRPGSRRAIAMLVVPYVFFYVFCAIRLGLSRPGSLLIVIESLLLCIASLLYFRELILSPASTDLERIPAFWMTTGILFYFALLFPCMFICAYLAFKSMTPLVQATYSINNYAQVFMTILFIKGMTCLKKQ